MITIIVTAVLITALIIIVYTVKSLTSVKDLRGRPWCWRCHTYLSEDRTWRGRPYCGRCFHEDGVMINEACKYGETIDTDMP